MAIYTDSDNRLSLRRILTGASLFSLLFPVSVMASTPPVQPSLDLEISAPAASPDTPLSLLVIWSRYGIPFHSPPESIIIDAFSVPDGMQVATFSVPRVRSDCDSEDACMYRKTISTADLPAGTLMLIATDPLSGAIDRQIITISAQGSGLSAVRARVSEGWPFFGISFAFAVVLGGILAIMIRNGAA